MLPTLATTKDGEDCCWYTPHRIEAARERKKKLGPCGSARRCSGKISFFFSLCLWSLKLECPRGDETRRDCCIRALHACHEESRRKTNNLFPPRRWKHESEKSAHTWNTYMYNLLLFLRPLFPCAMDGGWGRRQVDRQSNLWWVVEPLTVCTRDTADQIRRRRVPRPP